MLQLLAIVLVAIPAWIASVVLESRRRRQAPQAQRPYTWGFFQGSSGLIMGFWALVIALHIWRSENTPAAAVATWLFASGVWAVAGFYVLKRRRWAWVVHTVASLNPVWWVINGFYAWSRWEELTPPALRRGPAKGAAEPPIAIDLSLSTKESRDSRRRGVLVRSGVVAGMIALAVLAALSPRIYSSYREANLERQLTITFERDSDELRREAKLKDPGIPDFSFLGTAKNAVTFRICNSGNDTIMSIAFAPKTRRNKYSTEYNLAVGRHNEGGLLSTDRIIAPRTCVEESWYEPFRVYDTVFADVHDVRTRRALEGP